MGTWSYSGDPNGSTKDAVRFLIQDTNTNRQLVLDEEIEYALANEMNVYTAAASICDVLVAKAGGVKRKRISDFDIAYDPAIYYSMAGRLRARGAGHQVPYCGGISISDKQAQQGDLDAVAPAFPKGLDDNSGAPGISNPPNGGSSTSGGGSGVTDL